ncbi:RNA polymerase sigma factor [Pseudomonas sp. FP1154]|jgi:RNA polymerase sigma factor (sigma-70 family)|uniref:RNA polymerase sigma factor n=1 Tax=Pseudomonas rhizophila TaxID=2045200 RepID=A0ABN5JX37_9PSED|nr:MULTISPECIES: RNA polymerase sigma factor [Pseudomonas]AVU76732.1 RNA polymerase sigma factor [Pseudomonas rhizophila]MXR30175.1 sigma-70 family RNA polymerase sigma factor [Pseudomonas sp. PICF6]WLG20888.1 RNA polymerase sigma factor [Pseudomonas sp. FP1154]
MCVINSITYPAPASLLRQLDRRMVQKVRLFIRAKVANPDDAEDLLQATFLEALRNEHKFRHDSLLLTWLCGIAFNLIRSHFRRLYNQPFHDDLQECGVLEMADSRDVVSEVSGLRQLVRVFRAMETLPPNMEEVIRVAMEMEGNYLETAARLDIPVGTVRSRLSRAREQLKRRVSSEY